MSSLSKTRFLGSTNDLVGLVSNYDRVVNLHNKIVKRVTKSKANLI